LHRCTGLTITETIEHVRITIAILTVCPTQRIAVMTVTPHTDNQTTTGPKMEDARARIPGTLYDPKPHGEGKKNKHKCWDLSFLDTQTGSMNSMKAAMKVGT